MDKPRIAAIWTELKEYGDETQLGFPLSTIKVGELAELISENASYADTIEHLTKERDALKAQVATAREASDRVIERMAGELCSVHAEVELLKMLKPGVADCCSSCGSKILPDHVVLCQDCRG